MNNLISGTLYTANGKNFNVHPDRVEEFLQKYPDAKKANELLSNKQMYYTPDGKKFNVHYNQLERFKKDHPEARTAKGWEDHIAKQKAEIEDYNRRKKEADAKAEADRIKGEKDLKDQRDKLQQEHRDSIELRFKKEIESKYSPEQNWISNPTKLKELEGLSYEDKVKWLNENTKETYEPELSFEDPKFNIDASVIDETKLDMPIKINVMGIETSQAQDSEDNKLGDNFIEDVNKYNSDIQNILSNPILKQDGSVDYVKTQEAIDNIEANMPDGFEIKSVDWTEDELNKAYAEINKRISELSPEETERVISSENMTLDLNKAKNKKEEEDRITQEVFSELLEERKRKLEQYKKGEIDLTTEELASMVTVDQGMKDYMQRFLPSAEQITAIDDETLTDNENVLNAVNTAVSNAVASDPRFKYIQDSIINEVDTQAEAKLIEIRNKYKLNESITEEKLEKVQKEFTDWYNNSVSEKLQGNKTLKRLYQEYGLAANSSFEDLSVGYKRFKDDALRQIDDTINRYEDDDSFRGTLKEWSAKIKEQIIKQPTSVSTWFNEAQIGLRDIFYKQPARDYLSKLEDISEALESVTTEEAKDLTLDEITELLGNEGEAGQLANWLNNVKVMDGDVKLGDLINKTEDKLEEVEVADMVDVKQMLKAYEDMSKYKRYDSGKGVLTLEGFLDRTAGLIDQAPHMLPTMIGQGIVAGSAVATAASGGIATPLTSITAGAGTGLIALGSMIQGAMEYGGTYMDGIRRGLTEELGREPTAEEYLEALKNPEKYTSQGAALTAGAAVTGTEFLSDYITGKLTGSVGGAIAETPIGKAILSNTITRYLASVGISGYGGMKLNAAQEYLTEGFQEYLGQVSDNYIDKFVQGKEMDSIFTSNIRIDEIEEAANMGYKQGELFGSVALVSTGVGLSQIQKSYIQQAEDIAYGIDMRPGSSTGKAARAAFQRLQKAIEDDDSLSKSEKARQIEELSRIREASILTPSNITGVDKFNLMKLIMEQKRLAAEIKQENNSSISVNKIERKAEVDKQIENLIKSADERSNTSAMGLVTGQQVDQQQDLDSENQDSYSKIDNLIAGEDLDLNNRFDQKRILQLAGGTIQSALNRLYQKGGLLTRDQFKTRLENEYIQALTEYDVDKDINNLGIGQQTSNKFGLRANAVASENVRQQGDTISMSDEKAPQIGDTTQQQDFDAQEQEVNVKRDKKYLGGNEKVNEAVGPEAKSQIKNETSQEILSQVGKGSTAAQTSSAINNMFGDAKARGGRGLWNILGNKIGTFAKGYKNFVDNTVDADFIRALPAAYIKSSKRLSEILGVTKLGKTDKVNVKEDGTKSYSRPDVFSLGEITDDVVQQVKDYFKKSNPNRLGLLKKMSSEFAMESLQELKADQDFMQKLQTALGDTQSAEQFMNDLEAKMDQRTAEDTSLDVDRDTLAKTIKDKITEENIDDITPEALTRAIRKLEEFRKSSLTAGGLNLVAEAALRTLRAAIRGGAKLAQAIKSLIKTIKNALKNTKPLFELFTGQSTASVMRNMVKDIKTEFVASDGKTYTIQGPLNPKNKIHKEFLKDFIINKAWPVLPAGIFKGINFGYNTGSKEGNYFFTSEELADIRREAEQKHGKKQVNSRTKKIQAALQSKNSYFKKYNGKFNSAEYNKIMKDNYEGMQFLLEDMASLVDSDPSALLMLEYLFQNQASTGAGHFIKQFAMPIGNSKEFIDNKFLGEKEHVWPSNQVASLLFQAIKNNTVADIMPVIKENYFMIGITKNQDGLLYKGLNKNEGLRSRQTQEYNDSVLAALNGRDSNLALSPLVRYFNSLINGNMWQGQTGFNSNKMYIKGKSIASQYTMELDAKDQNADNIHYQNELTYLVMTGRMSQKDAVVRIKKALELNNAKAAMANLNAQNFPILEKNQRSFSQKKTLLSSLKARINALKINKKRKGLSAFDFDDTLAFTKEKVKYTLPNGKKGTLTAAEFAVQYETLLEQGAEFDYSAFDNVSLQTQKGPLAGKALERFAKYGPKDIFVVTARPNASQQAIKTFLDSIGLNIPIDNIITLEDGSPQAKADWLLGKAADGYNDFYFADDSALNVQVVKDILSQIDVKSRVQQSIADKATRLDQEMNELIEDATGIGADQEVLDVEARIEGKRKDKGFLKRVLKQFTITASADDFLGLAYYLFGKGEKGSRQQQWFIKNIIEPYNKAEQTLISAKMNVAKDFAALKARFPSLKRKKGIKGLFTNPLTESIGYKSFNKSQAIRVYLWDKQNMEIPGMSRADIDGLVAAVEADAELNIFADELQLIQKGEQYPAPTQYWIAGDIKSDILTGLDTTFRSEIFSEWNENIDIIFSEKNMNKLEAAFGAKYVEALRDSLKRMKSGSNRPAYQGSGARQVNEMMDWLNGSVAVAMFVNMRSGLLQMLSNVNFINWGDNNIYAAARAFASSEYVPTVIKLMNSDYLVNRRDGLKINVNEAELAEAANKGGIKGMLSYLLDKGFVLTRIFDTLAIATGGATFYINRRNSLLKQVNPETGKKYTQQEAETKAFDDFYAIAEETQQSSNPSKISSQQASFFGRVILSFQNVTMQYNRKAKKMLLDLVKRRKRPGMTQRESDLSNLSGVIYYVGMQNLIFNSLQQALFAVAFGDEEEKDRDKVADTINGMVDSLLFGLGFGGAIASTIKNFTREILIQKKKDSPEYEEAFFTLLDISPVIDAKVRNIRAGLRTFSWNMADIKKRGWSLDNPAYIAISSIISGFTNIPIDRVLKKINNIRQATDENVRTFERIALLLGWNGWNFGLPYWGRESTIEQEAANEEKLKEEFKASIRKAKAQGFTKRVPFTGNNSWKNGIPKGLKEGVDYVAIKRYDGIIQYYKKP